jgi:GT2 family glycosyltransferase
MPVELIIVNNGNPENVVDRLRALAASEPRVKLLTGHGNVGFACANNMGVAGARGAYIWILNPDCIFGAEVLEKLHNHAVAVSPPAMIGARILNVDGSDQRGSRRALLTPKTAFVEALHLGRFIPNWRLNRHEEQVPTTYAPIPAISGASMFLLRKDYDRINGFDEGYFLHVDDLDFCLRFHRAGGNIYFAPDVSVTHIGGTSKVTSNFVEYHKAKSFVHYFHGNFSDEYPLIFLWVLDVAVWGRYFLRLCSRFFSSQGRKSFGGSRV